MFDIPEQYKQARIVFTKKLKELGFMQFQKSVWICPYPCSEIVEALKGIYEIRPFVKLALVDNIDREKYLIKHFFQ